METGDHVTEVSQSEDRQPSDDLPVTFVQLWPVFELQAVLEGSRKLTRLLLSDDNGCYDNCYHSYLVYFTPESPESLAVLKQTNDENKMVGNSCLFKLRTCVQVLQLTTEIKTLQPYFIYNVNWSSVLGVSEQHSVPSAGQTEEGSVCLQPSVLDTVVRCCHGGGGTSGCKGMALHYSDKNLGVVT